MATNYRVSITTTGSVPFEITMDFSGKEEAEKGFEIAKETFDLTPTGEYVDENGSEVIIKLEKIEFVFSWEDDFVKETDEMKQFRLDECKKLRERDD